MSNQDRYTAADIITALRETKGLVSYAAQRLGCSVQTVYNYIERYPTVQAAVNEQREGIIDLAEGKLFAAISRGEPWAVAMMLKTLGKKRGYVERTEQEHLGKIGYTVDIGGDGHSNP